MSVLISTSVDTSFSISLSLSTYTSISDHLFLLRVEDLVMFCLHREEYGLVCSDETTVYF